MINLGIVGCGSVSEMYLDYLQGKEGLTLYACSDLNLSHAIRTAERYGISKVLATEELIGDDKVDIVLNLTNPGSHFDINASALRHKKALFCEKPFALNAEDAKELMELAKDAGCLFYAAPDTYYSRSTRAIKDYLLSGDAGIPLSVNVVSVCNPVECWHPNPEFFYKAGGGPLWDRGVYYLTSLVYLFGRIESVSSYSGNFIKKRNFGRSDGCIAEIFVDTPTHYSVLMKFRSGMTATMITSFDAQACPETSDEMTIICTDGVVKAPTPMEYGGSARAYSYGSREWKDIAALGKGISDKGDIRGAAIVEMAKCLESDELRWDNIAIAGHVVDVMCAIDESGKDGDKVTVITS